MPPINAPGVFIDGPPSDVHTIAGVATSITAFIGWAPRGPTTQAQRVSSWSDFATQFGSLDSRSLLGYAVGHFFLNGGQEAYIVRLAISDTVAEGVGAEMVLSPNTEEFETALGQPGNPSTGALGLLDQVDWFGLLCVPGETNPTILSMLEQYCVSRRAFLLADADATVRDANRPGNGPGFTGTNAAFYFPWLLAADPLRQNALQPYPPCGFVAGLYAAIDGARGVWEAPAGTDAALRGVHGTTVTLNEQQIGVLTSAAVNCIRSLNPYGTVVWGARTVAGNDAMLAQWMYVPVRRLALLIEASLDRGLQWVAFEPNDEPLWAQIRLDVAAFLQTLYRQGAFRGTTPEQAYFVRCDRDTTTSTDQDNGIVNIIVGFAPLRPAEFVIIQIQKLAGPR